MKQGLKNIYGHLPPFLRSIAASGHGYYLRSWRYGPETETWAKAALKREVWNEDQWRVWQQRELSELLHTAATRIPYYRAYWEERRKKGDDAPWEVLANWPVLTKEALRTNPEAFVAEGVDPKKLFKLSTSGTSGKPLTIWRSRDTMKMWYALFEARWRYWYGITRRDRWAILGGQLVAPVEQETPPFWVWNAGLNQLYMSTLHLAPRHVASYLTALKDYKITYIWGYASSLHALAQMAAEQGLEPPPLKVAISNAEALLPYQHESISGFFGCPVRNTYGMAEAVAAGSECEYGVMHTWPDAGIIEVLEDAEDTPAVAGSVGRFVCTGLINKDMPLIRYEVGDRGALATEVKRCACGRTLPVLAKIEGRTIDNVITADGRRIFWLNPVFYGLPLREAQIIQESLEALQVNVVPATGYSPNDTEAIVSRLKERVGDMDVNVTIVADIPRSANGKFRSVINKVGTQSF